MAEEAKKVKKISYKVTPERLSYKMAHLNPSQYQAQLYSYVKGKEIPFNEACGYNWTMLGGLLSRGLLTWTLKKDGTKFLIGAK